MFIDEALIDVKAGDGGNGCHAYERQPFKPKGKPDGGDGGRGGHVCLVGSAQMHTLQDMAYRRHFRGERGAHGKGSNKRGKNGEDITITVPLGTVVYNNETNQIIADCVTAGVPMIIACGGRGGRGNRALVSPKNRNPETVEEGFKGEEKKLRLVLKVFADVGLVGRPNAGKSTLLSRISRARPKIADYPFTTTEPHLGIVAYGTAASFIVADIPGLIEDSHKGKGLGVRFLRHIERTRVLAILVDAMSPDPKKDANVLVNELAQYSTLLADKPKIFILSKNDLITPDHQVSTPRGWLSISAATGNGLEKAVKRLGDMVTAARLSAADGSPVSGSGF
ncbi:MAG: GTPase ObgE [Chitinispirillaceae bacterium]|jgi:GTP-binding protein|nr:GTPase ObgE [Chitinispirillaceae bacterium]